MTLQDATVTAMMHQFPLVNNPSVVPFEAAK
jgi:hypothetical protein